MTGAFVVIDSYIHVKVAHSASNDPISFAMPDKGKVSWQVAVVGAFFHSSN